MATKRRAKSTKLGKDEFVQIRVEAAEKLAFSTAAQLSGLSMSAWMRERLRRICQQELEMARQPVPFLTGQRGASLR